MKTLNRLIGPIGVVPIGNVPEIVPKVVAAHISAHLKVPADVLSPLKNPEYAYDKTRCQYDAAVILEDIERMRFDEYKKVIGILYIDLFVPVFTHVFGEAQQGGKFALMSLFRLEKESSADLRLGSFVLERAAKVALHELGHLFNLFHCEDKHCLMRFTGILEELDQTPLYFCRYCSAFLKDALTRS